VVKIPEASGIFTRRPWVGIYIYTHIRKRMYVCLYT
jgi:hypothetical protein